MAARFPGFQRNRLACPRIGAYAPRFCGASRVKEGPLPGAFYIKVRGEEDTSLARGEASVLPMATSGRVFSPFGRKGEPELTSVILCGLHEASGCAAEGVVKQLGQDVLLSDKRL